MAEQVHMTKADKTRQFIIEKTAPIFNMKGYAGTSINDLTMATGLTKGSIYGNFANKDEVALAALDHNLKQVSNIFKSEIAKADSYREKLLVYTRVYQNFLDRPFPEGGCPILNTAIEADDTHPLLRQKAAEALLTWRRAIIRIIEKGVEAGEFSNYVKPEQIAISLMATIEGGIMIAKLLGQPAYMNQVLEAAQKLINDII
jgi:TetR/AcrR family transcriptional repressor of nem operon